MKRTAAAVTYGLIASHLHPRVPGGYWVRLQLARVICAEALPGARIGPRAQLSRSVQLKEGAGIGTGTSFLGSGTVVLGARLKMGPECMFITNDHPLPQEGSTFSSLHGTTRGIRVGEDVFIGARSVILPGVSIGDRALIAAGSVVTRDVPPETVVGGNPARIIRNAFTAPPAADHEG